MNDTKNCPYCAEEIRTEAVRCRYCRSRLNAFRSDAWHLSHPGRRAAGVAGAVGHALSVPVSFVRIGFVALTFVHLIGPLLYAALWFVIPERPGAESALDRLADLFRVAGGRREGPESTAPGTGRTGPGSRSSAALGE